MIKIWSRTAVPALFLMLPFAFAQPTSPADDPSRVTGDAVRHTALVGSAGSVRQKVVLNIPIGERLHEVGMSWGKWITGITFGFGGKRSQAWGNKKNDRKHSFELKEEEYVTGVKVHVDAQEDIDWMDFITSHDRLLHFGQPKLDASGAGIYDLKIPARSRLTGLTLYVSKGRQAEIQGIDALYQRAN